MVIWTQPAREDLHAIYQFIALDSKFYAKSAVRNIVEKAAIIPNNPQIGRIVPEFESDQIREIFIYSYRLIYQTLPENVVILAVVHGSRDLIKTGIVLSS